MQQKEEVGFGSTHLNIGIVSATGVSTVHWGVNMAAQTFPMNMAHDYSVVVGQEVGHGRNAISAYSIERSKLLWFIDDDVLPPNYALQRLWHALQKEPNAAICAGIYFSKSDTPTPVVFKDNGSGPYMDYKPGEVFEVPGFIGTGCMLIRTEIFKKIEEPWFQTIHFPDKITDDAYFCRKVKAAGYKILGHGGVLCGHYDQRTGKTVWPSETSNFESRVLSDNRPIQPTSKILSEV